MQQFRLSLFSLLRAGVLALLALACALASAREAQTLRPAPPQNRPLIVAAEEALPSAERSVVRRAGGVVAVVYPDLAEPYRSIFKTIINGIGEQAGGVVLDYPIGATTDSAGLSAQLRRSGARVVVALGRQGLKAVAGLDRDIPVVVGGVLSVPEAENRPLAGVSLTPDPAVLFAHMRTLMPTVRRVTVIYDPRQNDWLINLARSAAREQGLELVALEARDLGSAARLYRSTFAAADRHRDAIWLPQDATTVDEDTILPLVLKEAWSRSVPVFSSSFLHVKKGALFALYPDNQAMGRSLGRIALELATDPDARPAGVVPLQAVLKAINLRTASHLGLNIDYQQQRRFDFVFPEP